MKLTNKTEVNIVKSGKVASSERPSFEIRYLGNDRKVVKTYAVYENGKIDGFPDGALIVNRIPCLTHPLVGRIRILKSLLEEACLAIDVGGSISVAKDVRVDIKNQINKELEKLKQY